MIKTKIKSLGLFVAMLLPMSLSGQTKKPTLMVIPSDAWCLERGFSKTFDNIGEKKTIPDYATALVASGDLKVAITTLSGLMAERGFPLVDMEQKLKSIDASSAEDALIQSKDGSTTAETPYDKLKKTAKCDIVLDLYWKLNHTGPRRSLTLNLRALDSYTNKQVGNITVTGEPSMVSELPLLLQTAIMGGFDKFTSDLMRYFEDMQQNGREVALDIRTFDSKVSLEDEVGDTELNAIIEEWVTQNTVRGVFSLDVSTNTMMNFGQVRIPLYKPGTEIALDTRAWARELGKHLKSKGIVSKLTMEGLGKARLTLGAK